ncbi:50S ribosomal protein L24 [Methylogaea oryzae]|uniref:Large ribosomal subunit protein uL24 n=1 Tax=Methylogaea oryzae TaxID=1295382 RepID=A0A8D4VKI3_9GAMM|nr:50S ribosomal protein L24 [Methylogaea oryzae]BBL69788.1 50S ribosomal protein L24 [Methylogaea oryzae]
MRKIKKGDQVVVIAGKDKGKRGAVMSVDEHRVFVEGINVVKKHVKPMPARGVEGGIVDKTLSIHVSNVALFNPATKKADRVGIRTLEDGRKIRVFKSTSEAVDA